jgi:hypothetical protein
MNELEKMVWAAAFAAEFSREYAFRFTHAVPHLPIDGISGLSCAEIADLALDKFREAVTGDDASYLTPIKEVWEP